VEQRALGRAERALRPRGVWSIRIRLEIGGATRDLALFNLAIDSKLRACDLVRLRVDDVWIGGRALERATIMQKKTGRPVQFGMTEPTRAASKNWLEASARRSGQYLFPGPPACVSAHVDPPVRPHPA
jgi:integrase